MMEPSIALVYASIGVSMICYSYKKWKAITKSSFINDEIVDKRKHYRAIAVFGLLFIFGSFRYILHGVLWDMRLLPETMCMFLVGLAFGYFRCFIEPYYNSSVVEKLSDFCLYLRPFDVDRLWTNRPRGSVRNICGMPINIESRFCTAFSKKIAQTFAIGNPNSNMPTTLYTSSIYANDEEWKEVVRHLSQKSKVIILHVGASDGCLWEMGHCVENNYLGKTIFLVEDNKMFDLIRKVCRIDPIEDLDIDSFCIVSYDRNLNKWIVNKISSKTDINSVVDSFIESHDLHRTYYESREIPSLWWQRLAFSTNAIAYCIYNKWPLKNWIYMAVTVIVMFLASSFVLIAIILLPWLWIAPRISFRNQNSGGISLFASNNRSLTLWLCAFFLCNLIIYTTSWFLT